MSPPAPSRRRVLGLLTAGLVGTTGCAAIPNGPAPPTLVRARTRHLSSPTVEATVPVLERHVDAYRTRLDRVVPAAKRKWDEIEPDDLPDVPEYTHDDVRGAREFLADLDAEPRTSETVDEAMWHVDDAVGALVYAQSLDGAFDPERLYADARETLDAFASLSVDHACVSPAQYLPYARRIDHRRWWGRRWADAVVPGGEVRSGADRSTAGGQAALAGQHVRAEAALVDVRQYRAVAREQPLGDGSPSGERRPFADSLARNVEELVSRLEPLIDRFETFEAEHDEYPDAFADGVWGRGMRGRNETREGAYRATNGYPALGAAKAVEGFVHCHAFVDALETLDPASPPDADAVFAEKRAARRALRETLDADPSPFVRDTLRHASQAAESGDLTLQYFGRHDDGSPVRSHTEAWVDYHAARVAAERADEVETVLTRR